MKRLIESLITLRRRLSVQTYRNLQANGTFFHQMYRQNECYKGVLHCEALVIVFVGKLLEPVSFQARTEHYGQVTEECVKGVASIRPQLQECTEAVIMLPFFRKLVSAR